MTGEGIIGCIRVREVSESRTVAANLTAPV